MPDNLSNKAIIQQFYGAFFGRPAEPSGLNFWVNGVNHSGDMIGSAIKNFGNPNTPEFARTYPPGTSDEAFLATAYRNMFNRAPDAEGNTFWAGVLRDWQGTGMSAGEARAKILESFINAASGQVGTNDALTIKNKQLVADAMTESVAAHGTEFGYMSDTNTAKSLLGSVDHIQESVNAALARIKYGYVDGIDPSTGIPITLPTIVHAGNFGTAVLPDISKDEVLKFDASSDAPFTYTKYSGGTTGPGNFGVLSFQATRDKLDFTAFGLNVPGDASSIFIRDPAWTGAAWYNGSSANMGSPPSGYKTYPGFFNGKVFAAWELNAGTTYNSTNLFVDVNKNGALDPEIDLWMVFGGVSVQSIADSLFLV